MFDHVEILGPVWTPDPVVRSHPLNRGRVSWWLTLPGLDGGRQWSDLMGLNHGTLNNMTSASTSGWRGTTRPGGWGCLQFDGADDQVIVGNLQSLFSGTTQATITGWVKDDLTTPSGVGTSGLWSIDGGVNTHYPYTDNVVYMSTFRAVRVSFTNSSFDKSAWHHLAVTTHPTAGYVVYQNGRVAYSTTAEGTVSIGTDSRIGSSQGSTPTYRLSGLLDSVSLWTRALPAAEVQADYDLSRIGYPGVLRRWPGVGAGPMAPTGGGIAPIASYFNRRRKVG